MSEKKVIKKTWLEIARSKKMENLKRWSQKIDSRKGAEHPQILEMLTEASPSELYEVITEEFDFLGKKKTGFLSFLCFEEDKETGTPYPPEDVKTRKELLYQILKTVELEGKYPSYLSSEDRLLLEPIQ